MSDIAVTKTVPLKVEVMLSEEDNSIYVKFEGFEDEEDAEDYATFLSNTLPLMLFESEIIH
jgi:hypothetical protein